MYVGVDGSTDGWIAVSYDDTGFTDSELYPDIETLWDAHGESAETILIDVPIGLREKSNKKRPCDDAARQKLKPIRHSSVFAVPVRSAVQEDSYEEAKRTQEGLTSGSLGVQSWGIADLIEQLDRFLLDEERGAVGTIREAHPEVCFWALNDESPTEFSKTGQPAAAFWERVGILKNIDPNIIDHVWDAAKGLDAEVRNDDIIDAFVLALTASPLTGELRCLPEEWPEGDQGDPKELPMEMVYAFRS